MGTSSRPEGNPGLEPPGPVHPHLLDEHPLGETAATQICCYALVVLRPLTRLHHERRPGILRCVTVGAMLLTMLVFWLIVILSVRLVPVVRHGRKATLPRPKPCSMRDAQQAVDRLIAAGFDAEIAEHDDNGLNMWANTRVGGEVRPDERYVVRVPRRQAAAASRIEHRP